MTVADIKQRAKPATPANDTPGSLWESFALAQEQFGPLIKNKVGAHKASYAPLDGVLEMVRPILNDNGLVLTQPTLIEDGVLIVKTLLVHKTSKEMHECTYPAGPLTLQHQQLGAGVTYARRYSLLSILGVFPENEDDDGEKAGAAGGERHPSRDPQTRQQQATPQVRPQARKFVDKACADIEAAGGDVDAVWATFDEIKARPGWEQLSASERQVIILAKGKALPNDAG